MKRSILFLLIALVAALPASATNGYFLLGQGTAAKGMAGASIALPHDSLSGAMNPAALSRLRPGMFVGIAFFNPNRSYTVEGNPTGYPGTFGLTPGTVESESTLFPMPGVAANWVVNDRLSWSLAMLAQGGMNTDYRTATFYGSDHTGINLSQMFLEASMSWKMNDAHALGLSAIGAYQMFEAQGLQAFGQMSSNPAALSNNEQDSSTGLGFRLGYLGQLTPALSIGAAWTPQISMSKFDDYAGLFCQSGMFDIPASATAGVAWKATNRLTLATDVQWIEYSGVDSVGHPLMPNLMGAPLGGEHGPGFGWEDMTAVKIGAQWQASDLWTLRGGVSVSEQPIPESEVLFNILAPGVIDDHVTFGFTRQMPGGHAFHFSLMRALENSVKGGNALEAPGAQQIELTMDEWEMEFGWSMSF